MNSIPNLIHIRAVRPDYSEEPTYSADVQKKINGEGYRTIPSVSLPNMFHFYSPVKG